MSTNITDVKTLRSTLRISKANLAKARKMADDGELPEGDPLTGGGKTHRVVNGFARLPAFHWYGESSGNLYQDGTLARFVALTEGEADLFFTWEGGDFFTGLRVRDGATKECDVVMGLAKEESE